MKKKAQELFQMARTALERAGAHARMAEAAARHLVSAEEQGLATHGMSRVPFYCSMLGIHLLPVARAGLVGLAFTNSPAAIPAWGGKKGLFGTNPVAGVFPRKEGRPIVVDLALATVVRGRIMMAMRKGERIPEGWAGNRPRIGQAFIAIDPRALAGMERYLERTEAVVAAMLADPEVRLPGARRFASETAARAAGIEIPDELLGQIEKLCSTP